MPRIVLIDDYSLVLEALTALLRLEFDIVATCTSGSAALTVIRELRPDVVLLEVELPGMRGIDIVRTLRATQPEVRCMFVTRHTDPVLARGGLAAGAHGYILKDASPGELLTGLRTVAAGGTYVSPAIGDVLHHSNARRPDRRAPSLLTLRQQEILARVADGMTGKEIADDLSIALKTVEFHKAQIARRLGLRSVAAMTRYAVEHQLVDARKSSLAPRPVG